MYLQEVPCALYIRCVMYFTMRFSILGAFLLPVRAALYHNVASLPSLTYDFIVVGGKS
jgi:hypothetical protein